MTTAMNRCRYFWRHKRREVTVQMSTTRGREISIDRIDLEAAIGSLPPRQRQAVILFYVADVPVPGIAQLMEVAEGTVKAHLAQARETLRERMEVRNV